MTNPPRRVVRATSWLVAGRIYAALCALSSTWILAQTLELADLGRFAFYIAVLALLKSFGDFGTGQLLVQRTAHDEATIPLELSAARRVRAVMSLAGALLVSLYFWSSGEADPMWLCLAALHPLTYLLELTSTVYKNRVAWVVPVIARSAASTMVLLSIWTLAEAGCARPAVFLAAQVGCHLIANIGLHLAARRHLTAHPGGPAPWRPLLLAALPLGVAAFCQQAYHHADNFLITRMLTEADLGLYSIAFRFLSVGIMVALFATTAALPLLSKAHREGCLATAHARYLRPLTIGAGISCGLAYAWCDEVLGLFGPEFPAAADAMHWMLISCLAIHFGAVNMTSLVACGRTKAVLRIALSGLLLDVGLNLWLLPQIGIEGAGLARAATELFVAGAARLALTRCDVPLQPANALRALLLAAGLFLFGAALSPHLPLDGVFDSLHGLIDDFTPTQGFAD
jgi:O-antigen/teichoic acid export membrane protein